MDAREELEGKNSRAHYRVEKVNRTKTKGSDITENKLSGKQVTLANERLRYLLSSTSAVIYTTRTKDDYEATFVSENITQMTGYKPVEMDKPDFWISHIHPDDRQRILAEVSKTFDKEFRRYEYRFLHKSGRYIWIQDEARLIRDAAGEPLELVGSWKDITEHKRAEEAMRETKELFELFVRYSPIYAYLKEVTSTESRVIQASENFNQMIGASSSDMAGKTMAELFPPEFAAKITADDWDVVSNGKMLKLEENLNGRIYDTIKFPIVRGDKTLVIGYTTDITEQKKAEESLRESENKFKTLADEAFDSIVIHDGQRIIEVNKAFCRLWGYDFKEAVGMKIDEFFAPECWQDVKKRVQSGYDKPYEANTIRKDGTRFQVEIAGKPIIYKGKPVRIATTRDITERKRLEETLEKERQELKLIIDSSPIIVFYKDKEGRFARVNKAFAESLNIPEEKFLGKTVFDFYSAEIAQGMINDDLEVFRTGRPKLNIVEQYESARGIRWVQTDKVPIFNKDGILAGLVGFAQDITERKRAEKALRESELRFRELFEHMSSGVAVYEAVDDGKDFIFKNFNKSAEKIDNIRREEIIGKSVLKVFPGVRDLGLFEIFQRVWRTGKSEHHPASLYKDKRIAGWRENYVYKLPSGEIAAVYEDITVRKQAEEKLRKSEQEKELILSNVAEMISYLDRELRIVWTNKAACNMAGMSPQEMIGRYCYEIWCHAERPCPGCPMKKAIETGQPQEGEIRSDSKVWFMRGYPVLGDDGSILGVVETALDITERKMIEESLAKEHSLLRSLVDAFPGYIYVKDVNSRFVFGNASVAAHLGVKSPEALSGKTDFDFFPKEMAQRFLKEEQEIIMGGKAIIDREQCSKIDIAHTVTKVPWRDDKGNIIGIIGINHDITERKQAEKKLLEYQEQLKSLASQLFLTAENERRHLATGVHNHLGQQLAIIKLRLQSLMETVRDLEILRALKQTCSEVDQAIEDSHSLTFELSNPVLYELGLEAAIEQWLTEEIGEKHGIKCSFISDIGATELNQEISIVLFQAVRELLINVVKHAKASTVEVIARKKGEMVEITVKDNGIGFGKFDKALNVSDSKKGGFGLFSIKERIGYLGGSLNMESDSQNGTRATISMPLKTIRQLQVREEPNNEDINRR